MPHLALLCLVVALSGCGFHLRGDVVFPGDLRVEGHQGPGVDESFLNEFRRSVKSFGVRKPVGNKGVAGTVHVYQLLRLRRPITLGRFGRANEFDLAFRLVYDVRNDKGEVISPRDEIELHRDYFNDQSQPIAQDEEELQIRSEMLKEITQTLLRRVTYLLEDKAKADTKS